jgi:hypothetical protein
VRRKGSICGTEYARSVQCNLEQGNNQGQLPTLTYSVKAYLFASRYTYSRIFSLDRHPQRPSNRTCQLHLAQQISHFWPFHVAEEAAKISEMAANPNETLFPAPSEETISLPLGMSSLFSRRETICHRANLCRSYTTRASRSHSRTEYTH